MKRLLAFLIVCAITSAASAASMEVLINESAYTGQDVAFSDIVKFVFHDDRGPQYLVGTIAIGSYINVSDGDNYSHTWTAAPSMGGWTFTPVAGGYTSAGNAAWMFQNIPAGGVLFVHEFHVPDIEESTNITVDYSIDYTAAGVQTIVAGQVVMRGGAIPEPGTIGLLCLGALSLLRRRK